LTRKENFGEQSKTNAVCQLNWSRGHSGLPLCSVSRDMSNMRRGDAQDDEFDEFSSRVDEVGLFFPTAPLYHSPCSIHCDRAGRLPPSVCARVPPAARSMPH